MWAGFISLIKIPWLTLNKIIRYFYFQPLLTTNLRRLFSTDRWKIDLCLVAAFGKFLADLGFLVPLLFEKCVYIFVAYHNESCCKLIFRTTNKQYSLRKVQRDSDTDIAVQYHHTTYYIQKVHHAVPDVGVVLILECTCECFSCR